MFPISMTLFQTWWDFQNVSNFPEKFPLSYFWPFKQIHCKSTIWRNIRNRTKTLCWMPCTLTKGWHLCCFIFQCRKLNVYLNIYSCRTSFLFRGSSKIQFNHKINRTNKGRYFDETIKKSGKYCKQLKD